MENKLETVNNILTKNPFETVIYNLDIIRYTL